jgi:hypothetical protein
MTRKQLKEQAARYAKFVEWSEEDKCFIGRCPELVLGGVHGNDEAKVYAELCAAVEEMIAVIHADGKEMPRPLLWRNFPQPRQSLIYPNWRPFRRNKFQGVMNGTGGLTFGGS